MTTRICSECQGDMGLRRADAIFCSTRCRVAAHRKPSLPRELTSRARWVRHDRVGRPFTVTGRVAMVNIPAHWSSYADAKNSDVGAGMGFVLNGDGIGCIDLDDCMMNGRVLDWAQEIIDANPSTFTERSRSGNGIHIWGLLESAPGRRIRDGRNIEIYSRGRYIALGTPLAGTPLRLEPLIIP